MTVVLHRFVLQPPAIENLPQKNKDVCVVGGGASGIYAAYLLEQKGYDVVVFEKEDVVGGKTVPPIDSTTGNTLNRHLFIPTGMPTVKVLKEQFGILDFPKRQGLYFTLAGQIVPALPPPAEALNTAIVIWITLLTTTSVGVDANSVVHETDLVSDLYQSSSSWLVANGMAALIPAFYLFLTNFGYDFLNELPALYIVTALGIDLFVNALNTNWADLPYEKLLQTISADLNDVRLNSTVKKIKVKGKFRQVIIEGGPTTRCDNVIAAFPQSSEAMYIFKGLDSTTTALFDQVKIVYYYEVILSNLPEYVWPVSNTVRFSAGLLYDPSNNDPSTPNVYLRDTSTGDATVLFNSADIKREPEELFMLIQSHLSLLYPGYIHPLEDMSLFKEHHYLPHVSTSALEEGFYQDLAAVQGKQGVFYTGGLLDFELVEKCFASTEAIINKHF